MGYVRRPLRLTGIGFAPLSDFRLVPATIEVFINGGWTTQQRWLTQRQLEILSDGKQHRWGDDDNEEIVARLHKRSRR